MATQANKLGCMAHFQFTSVPVYFLCISCHSHHSDHKEMHAEKLAEQEQSLKNKYQSIPDPVPSNFRKDIYKTHQCKQNIRKEKHVRLSRSHQKEIELQSFISLIANFLLLAYSNLLLNAFKVK